MKCKAIFKFNSGMLAILCSRCSTIIKTGRKFTPREMFCCSRPGGDRRHYMPPQYCNKCKLKFVDEFQTKYKEGFISKEMRSLCDKFEIDVDEFNKMLGINTGLLINNECITFKDDVSLAFRCILEEREKLLSEWD